MTDTQTKSAVKSKLVLYSGGGYDGCIWEMNWFVFDSEGRWHNLYHSGYSGIKDDQEDKARALYQEWETEVESEDYDLSHCPVERVIDLTDEKAIEAFSKEYETVVTLFVLKSVNNILTEYDGDQPMFFICDHCDEKIYPLSEIEESHAEGLSGNGGVGLRGSNMYCSECYNKLSCSYCGEFDTDTEKQFGYCQWHFETALRKWLESFGDEGIQYLEVTNSGEIDLEDYVEYYFCLEDWTTEDHAEGDNILWMIQTNERDKYTLQWYISEAPTEHQALDELSRWTEGQHFEAKIWKAKDYLKENLENLDTHVH